MKLTQHIIEGMYDGSINGNIKSDGVNCLYAKKHRKQLTYHFICMHNFTSYCIKIGRHPYRSLDEARLIARVLFTQLKEGNDNILEYAYRHFRLARLPNSVKKPKEEKKPRYSKKWIYPKKYDMMGYKKNCNDPNRKLKNAVSTDLFK